MFQYPSEGADASTASVDQLSGARSSEAVSGKRYSLRSGVAPSLSDPQYETVRHMVFGSLTGVRSTIQQLYQLNYADPHAWSKPIPTGRPNEVMVILTKKIRRA